MCKLLFTIVVWFVNVVTILICMPRSHSQRNTYLCTLTILSISFETWISNFSHAKVKWNCMTKLFIPKCLFIAMNPDLINQRQHVILTIYDRQVIVHLYFYCLSTFFSLLLFIYAFNVRHCSEVLAFICGLLATLDL